jgi:hypothetical protein
LVVAFPDDRGLIGALGEHLSGCRAGGAGAAIDFGDLVKDKTVVDFCAAPPPSRSLSARSSCWCQRKPGGGMRQVAGQGAQIALRINDFGQAGERHQGPQSHGCAGQTVRPSLHSISQALAGEAVDPKFRTPDIAPLLSPELRALPRQVIRT